MSEDRLLFDDEVAALLGVKVGTVRHHARRSREQLRGGKRRLGAGDFPLPVDKVSRPYTRPDGRSGTMPAPRWRETDITRWLANRKGPGGRLPKTDGPPSALAS